MPAEKNSLTVKIIHSNFNLFWSQTYQKIKFLSNSSKDIRIAITEAYNLTTIPLIVPVFDYNITASKSRSETLVDG